MPSADVINLGLTETIDVTASRPLDWRDILALAALLVLGVLAAPRGAR